MVLGKIIRFPSENSTKEEHMKKVLSFVLSVAMVICLMPAMAFADDTVADATTATGLSQFSDADSIDNTHREAVAVLVGLGVIDGMGDGTFQPQGDLTRAQASKLVATVVKSGDKKDIPAPPKAPFTDVAQNHWGAGAIQFGVDNGYINGMGDGTFVPDGNVTTAQLATMLCKLLGYSVEDINYHWPENAMAYANNAGLLISINKEAGEKLNREEAAQMIYNALISETVVKSSISGSDSHDVRGNTGYDPVNNKYSQDYRNNNKDLLQQLIEKYFPKVTFVKDYDVFGRPSTVWKNGKEDMTDEITEAPVYSYTSREVDQLTDKDPGVIATKTLKNDLDGYIAEDASVIVNGVLQTYETSYIDEENNVVRIDLPSTINEDFSEYLANIISQYTGNGVLVEVYADEKDTQIERIIVVDYDVDTVKKVDSKTGEITLKNNGSIDKKEDYYSAISTVGKGDFVLVAADANGTILDAYLPTATANAPVTELAYNTKPGREDAVAKIGDKDYLIAHEGIIYEDPYGDQYDSMLPVVNTADNGTVYVDKYGYVVAYSSIKLPDWALLTSVYLVEKKNSLGESANEWYGQLVKENGTVENVPLLYINDPNAAGYNTYAAFTTREVVNEFMRTQPEVDGNNWFSQSGVLVTYDETASGYRLSSTDYASVGVNNPRTSIDSSFNKGSKKIDDYYLADRITVITPTGKKASTLTVTTDNQIVKAFDSTSYKYVAKKLSNGRYMVTTIYVTDSTYVRDTNAVVKVVDVLSQSASGSTVKYYTDDSAEAKTIRVSNEYVSPGFYYVEAIKEGMYLDSNVAINTAEIKIGRGDTAFRSLMTLGGEEYVLTSDAAAIDLSEGEQISISDLVEQIASIGATEEGENVPEMTVSFAYDKADDGTMTVRQVYIEE